MGLVAQQSGKKHMEALQEKTLVDTLFIFVYNAVLNAQRGGIASIPVDVW